MRAYPRISIIHYGGYANLLKGYLMREYVEPTALQQSRESCLSERRLPVSESDRDEVLEEVVEPLDVAGRVGRKVTRPLDGLLEGGIRSVLAVNVPPPGRFENHDGIRRRVLAGESAGDGLDFLRHVIGVDGV